MLPSANSRRTASEDTWSAISAPAPPEVVNRFGSTTAPSLAIRRNGVRRPRRDSSSSTAGRSSRSEKELPVSAARVSSGRRDQYSSAKTCGSRLVHRRRAGRSSCSARPCEVGFSVRPNRPRRRRRHRRRHRRRRRPRHRRHRRRHRRQRHHRHRRPRRRRAAIGTTIGTAVRGAVRRRCRRRRPHRRRGCRACRTPRRRPGLPCWSCRRRAPCCLRSRRSRAAVRRPPRCLPSRPSAHT